MDTELTKARELYYKLKSHGVRFEPIPEGLLIQPKGIEIPVALKQEMVTHGRGLKVIVRTELNRKLNR